MRAEIQNTSTDNNILYRLGLFFAVVVYFPVGVIPKGSIQPVQSVKFLIPGIWPQISMNKVEKAGIPKDALVTGRSSFIFRLNLVFLFCFFFWSTS